jgi:Peptidyl-tRNA hydrolase
MYDKTKHNVGKKFIDYVASKYKTSFESIKGKLE